MKLSEGIIIAIGYVLSFFIAAFIIYRFKVSNPGLALVVGAIIGTQISAWLYHKRGQDLTSNRIKAIVGVELSLLAIFIGLCSQAILQWIAFPEITLSISAVGSFIFPFVIFGQIQKAFNKSKK